MFTVPRLKKSSLLIATSCCIVLMGSMAIFRHYEAVKLEQTTFYRTVLNKKTVLMTIKDNRQEQDQLQQSDSSNFAVDMFGRPVTRVKRAKDTNDVGTLRIGNVEKISRPGHSGASDRFTVTGLDRVPDRPKPKFLDNYTYFIQANNKHYHSNETGAVIQKLFRRQLDYRAAVVTLIDTTDLSIAELHNMALSLVMFHPNASDYPLLIFHEERFNSIYKDRLFGCCPVLRLLNVVLVKVNLREPTDHWIRRGNSRFVHPHPLGYRLMCRFFGYGLFRHPLIQRLDYIMRLDTDSYFRAPLEFDLIRHVHTNKLDYIYRAVFEDASLVGNLDDMTKMFLYSRERRLGGTSGQTGNSPLAAAADLYSKVRRFLSGLQAQLPPLHGLARALTGGGRSHYSRIAVYNNFFVTRPAVFNAGPVAEFGDFVVGNFGFLKHRIGDANLHAYALALHHSLNHRTDSHEQRHIRFVVFPYDHNCHIHSSRRPWLLGTRDVDGWAERCLRCGALCVCRN